MTDRLKSSDGTETKSFKSAKPLTKAYIAGTALAAAGAMLATTGCENGTPKTVEALSPAEAAAQAEAHKVFEDLKVTDIVRCQVKRIAKGPLANYQGEKKPTLKVSMSVEPGDRYADKWFADGGSKVGDYSAEIQWSRPGIQVSHELLGQGESRYAGAAVPEEKFDPESELQPRNPDAPFFEFAIDNSSKKIVTYIIPVNDNESFQGKRKLSIDASIGTVRLMESHPSSSTIAGTKLSESCASVNLDVTKGEVKVLSIEDVDGKAINSED